MWECKKCGACCRVVNCPYLKDNLCSIYEQRPDICRVDKMYEILIKNNEITKERWYEINKIVCNYLQAKEEE